jgi:predicted metal-dependent peptidase
MRRRIAQKMVETLHAAKAIGRVPAEMERLVDELLKPMIDWRRIVRSALTKGIGRRVKRTWSRPSRKAPECYPGKETLKASEVVMLIDTSGSIGGEELRRFASEAYGALRESSRVVVIPWDATAYEPIILRGYGDVEKVKVLRGGGGTMIRDALKVVKERFPSADKIAILSDWHIGDLGSEEVQRLLREMAGKIVAFTTDARPPEFLEWYKIEITP